MNTKQQGDVGVAMAIAYYTKEGYVVCYPLTDNARYDLIVEKDGVISRVQCKCTDAIEKGSYNVNLRTSGGNQSWSGTIKKISADETDILFVYSMDGASYQFPPEVFDGRSKIALGKQYQIYRVA